MDSATSSMTSTDNSDSSDSSSSSSNNSIATSNNEETLYDTNMTDSDSSITSLGIEGDAISDQLINEDRYTTNNPSKRSMATLDKDVSLLDTNVKDANSSSDRSSIADSAIPGQLMSEDQFTNNSSKRSIATLEKEVSLQDTSAKDPDSSSEGSSIDDDAISGQRSNENGPSNASQSSNTSLDGDSYQHRRNGTISSSSKISSASGDTSTDQSTDDNQDNSSISANSNAATDEEANQRHTGVSDSHTSSESESPPCTASRLFDQLVRDHPGDFENKAWMQWKPSFVPVIYDPDEIPAKYRRLTARGREINMREKLAVTCSLTEKEIDVYAKSATYYPGTTYMPLNRVISYTCTPPRVSLSSSSNEGSPNYLFKDLPEKTKTPIRQPKTPDRRLVTNACVTPKQNVLVDVNDHLSPIFDRLKVQRKHRKQVVSSKLSTTISGLSETFKHDDQVIVKAKRRSSE